MTENTKRIIGAVTVVDGQAVQSFQFKNYLPLGRPNIVLENLNRWGVDEIILSDISYAKSGKLFDLKNVIEMVPENCFTPITYVGGLVNIQQVRQVIRFGADKVGVNSAILDFDFLRDIVFNFGSQALVISIDLKESTDGSLSAYVQNGKTKIEEYSLEKLIDILNEIKIGEFLFKFINRDGSKKGFNCDFIPRVRNRTDVPILLGSGSANLQSFYEAFQSGADGLVAGNIFSHTEHVVPLLKNYLISKGICLRPNEYYVGYKQGQFDRHGRLQKFDESCLEDLMYLPAEKVEI